MERDILQDAYTYYIHKPKKHFRGAVETDFKTYCLNIEDWEQMTKNLSVWNLQWL